MISFSNPVYVEKNAKELIESIEECIKEWERENEAIVDTIIEMTLDHSERKEKSFWEVVGNPENYQELIKFQSRNLVLDEVISTLKGEIYSGYKETLLTEETSKERAPNMGKEASMEWIGSKVKPRILEGTTTKQIIADELCVDESTITVRLQRVFGKDMLWKIYVEKVQQGTL